jgi:MFS family permease
MTALGIATEPLSDREHGVQLRRAVIASTIGTTIEWYDFFLYSTVTGLVFAKLYFPASDPLVGTLQAFGIYAVGFVARPVGAAIFGHYGDRIGRKAALIATLLLMGIATFLVAFVPTYAQIGVWGAVILTILRFIQGVGVGGEWGGSVLLSMEWRAPIIIAASSPPGRNSACRPGCSWQTSRCSPLARSPAASSSSGVGAFRSS